MTPLHNAYLSGHVKCGGCEEQSPTSTNPLEPFRWLARHVWDRREVRG